MPPSPGCKPVQEHGLANDDAAREGGVRIAQDTVPARLREPGGDRGGSVARGPRLLLGLAGTIAVLHGRPMSGEAGWGWFASGVALVSITLGTLYQKRYCSRIDWRAGNFVQFAAAGLFFVRRRATA